jgi:tryptophanyl-tRNA synthetase
MSKKEIVVSGIRPTGKLHLGNYFGAVVNFLKLQETHDCYFFIADYHSLTTHPDSVNLKQSIRHIMAEYLALGLDPTKCALYIQSDLPETAELYLLLNMFAYKGELERVSTFKEKVKTQPNNINAGLLTYPALMAADILIHQADLVPVGKDQEQHLEMTRDFAQRFNHTYQNEVLPLPQAFSFGDELVKVPGLTAQGKMSKSNSEKDAIYFTDEPKILRKKIMSAVTDSGPTEPNSKPSEGVQNIFELMRLVSNADVIEKFKKAHADCTIRYGDLKGQLADDVEQFVAPFREKIDYYYNNPEILNKVALSGQTKAKASARKTLDLVRGAAGLGL